MIVSDYKQLILFVMAWTVTILAGPWPGMAHPLGNFSINQYSALRIEPHRIDLHYIIDMAEIPTFQALQANRMTADGNAPSAQTYLTRQGESLKNGLRLEIDGQRLDFETVAGQIIFPAGSGQLHTMKLNLRYRASLDQAHTAQRHQLTFLDSNFPGRAGWKEVIAMAAPGVSIEQSTVPDTDRSQTFSNYPADLLNSPPQVLEAQVVFVQTPVMTGARTASLSPLSSQSISVVQAPHPTPTLQTDETTVTRQHNPPSTIPQAFAALITPQASSPCIALLAFAVAIGLGAFHALEPGHGKSVVAAYLVGSRGTARHALWLGLIVTATHTAGVYVLGAITLYASQYIVPEQLYPGLSVISGFMIAGLGGYLFMQRYRGSGPVHSHEHHELHPHAMHAHALRYAVPHAHSHGHHDTHDHAHHHGHHHHLIEGGDSVTFRQLLALGVTGGMVPCPAALVVLLSAVALHRVGFGLLLIVAFSVGLAAILVAIGLLMVYARRFMARFQGQGVILSRWLPLTSAGLMTLFGFAMMAQALKTAGVRGL